MNIKIKKRIYKDKPYTLNYDEMNNVCYAEFKNNQNIICKVNISNDIYDVLDQFELEDISQIHKYRSHIEHSELRDETLYKRCIRKPIDILEQVEKNILIENIMNAINKLNEVQKRRIKMYYLENKKTKTIALIENCSSHSVRVSIRLGLENIKSIINQ